MSAGMDFEEAEVEVEGVESAAVARFFGRAIARRKGATGRAPRLLVLLRAALEKTRREGAVLRMVLRSRREEEGERRSRAERESD